MKQGMKRGRAVLGMVCAAAVLAGCQPTTDEIIVIPKNGIAGARMMDETTAGSRYRRQRNALWNFRMSMIS